MTENYNVKHKIAERAVNCLLNTSTTESTGARKNTRKLTNALAASLLAISALSLTACNSQAVSTKVDMSVAIYQKDRLGLCYMVLGHTEGANLIGNSKGFTITWIPCTPEVETAIANDGGQYHFKR